MLTSAVTAITLVVLVVLFVLVVFVILVTALIVVIVIIMSYHVIIMSDHSSPSPKGFETIEYTASALLDQAMHKLTAEEISTLYVQKPSVRARRTT